MGNIAFTCPECQASLEVDESGAGQTVNCPTCSKPLRIPDATTVSAPPPAIPPAIPPSPPPMRSTPGTVPGPAPAPAGTQPGAIWSMVLGILSLVCFGPLAAIPAVICGHVALSSIRKSGGATGGNGMAMAGLIMGYISIALMVLLIPLYAAIAIPSFVKARDESMRKGCINNLRIMDAAKEATAMEHGWEPGQRLNAGSAEEQQVLQYVKRAVLPVCPKGGQYTWNNIGTDPECSLGPSGHTL